MDTLGIPLSWEGLGISGIVLFGILSLFRGWIYPGSWVEKLLKNKDAQLAEKDALIATLMKFQEPVLKLLETLNEAAKHREDK